MRISLTPITRFYRVRNFSLRRASGFVGGQFFYPFADVAVLRSERKHQRQKVDSSFFIIEGCFWGI